VAARAGVSLGTVSKAFDENAKVSTDTRERVRRAAKELGYHPSAVARAMVRKRMDTIGVILPPNMVSPVRSAFYSTIFHALLQAAAPRDQDIAICTGRRWIDAATSLPRFRDGRCDGFVVFWQPEESDLIKTLLDAKIPLVLVNDRGQDPRLSYVDIDSAASARTMTEYLRSLGHQRIALISGDSRVSSLGLREQSYRAVLDISVAGHDDVPGVAQEYPALTTMRQPFLSIAERALDLLLTQEPQQPTGRHVLMPAELIVRASTGPPPINASEAATPGKNAENKEVDE
jgi:LacI family transcriptional regulator